MSNAGGANDVVDPAEKDAVIILEHSPGGDDDAIAATLARESLISPSNATTRDQPKEKEEEENSETLVLSELTSEFNDDENKSSSDAVFDVEGEKQNNEGLPADNEQDNTTKVDSVTSGITQLVMENPMNHAKLQAVQQADQSNSSSKNIENVNIEQEMYPECDEMKHKMESVNDEITIKAPPEEKTQTGDEAEESVTKEDDAGMPSGAETKALICVNDDASSGNTALDEGSEGFVPPEGGWGWLVCFASFWTNGVLFGVLNIFGILFVELLEEFKDEGDDAYFKLSWIGALEVATTFFMSTFSSILVDKFGIQLMSGIGAVIATAGMLISSFVNSIELLYFTYGILIGLGSSLIYTPSMTILGHYFKKRLGLVNGIVSFGSAVFTLVLSTTLPVLLENIGVWNTMRVMSILFGMLGACPFIWKPLIPRQTRGLEGIVSTESIAERCGGCARSVKKMINLEMFKNKGYRIWIIGVPIAFMGYFIPFVHIVEHTKQMFPGQNAAILVVCIGGISGFSRLASGKLADAPKINRVWIMQFSFVLLGISTSLVPFASHYGVLIFLACLMGIGDGCFICMLGPIAYDLLGPQGMGQGIGVLLGLMSIPMTVGPPLAGYLRGVLGTYKVAFLIAGTPPIVGACVLFLMPQSLRKQAPAITMTDTIVSMSTNHLDRLDDEEEIVIQVQAPEMTRTNSGNDTTTTHESNGILHSQKAQA